jgi:hypothetical protein
VPLVDRSETETIETVWTAFLAYGLATKACTDGAASVDRNSPRNRVVLATSPAHYDASTTRIWFVGVDDDANSSSQLLGRVNRGRIILWSAS